MTDFRVGDRVRLVKRHPEEGWLGIQTYRDHVGVIVKVDFMHKNERYYRVQFDGRRESTGALHTMLERHASTPFEEAVMAYIRAELPA